MGCIARTIGGPLLAGCVLALLAPGARAADDGVADPPCPAPDTEPPAARTTLAVVTAPADAHVYVHRAGSEPASDCLGGACTGSCTLALSAGRHWIDAGLTHGSRTRAPGELALLPGTQGIQVSVRENHARDAVLGAAAAAGVGLIVGALVVGADGMRLDGGMEMPPLGWALMGGSVLCLGIAYSADTLMPRALVTIRPWSIPAGGERP